MTKGITYSGVKVLSNQDILELLDFKDMQDVHKYLNESPNEIIAMLIATILHQDQVVLYATEGSSARQDHYPDPDYEDGPLHDE